LVQHIRRESKLQYWQHRENSGCATTWKRPHLGKSLQNTAGMCDSAEGPSSRKARMQTRVTKQNSRLKTKEKTHNLSFSNTELISKCEETDDR